MDTLEDLQKFIESGMFEFKQIVSDAPIPVRPSEYDYYCGMLEAYIVIFSKIKEILSK